MFSQKPIIIEYDFDTSSVWDANMYLNAMYSENGKRKIQQLSMPK